MRGMTQKKVWNVGACHHVRLLALLRHGGEDFREILPS
jgi:hypothetical protein